LQTHDHQHIYLCSMYRPPDKGVDYIETLRYPMEKLLAKHRGKPPIIFIAGDLNFPLINWELNPAPSGSEGGSLSSLLDDFYLQQLVTVPTRHSQTASSILDLIITSHSSLITDSFVGREFSDHCLLSFFYQQRDNFLKHPWKKKFSS
jgi:Endonuclease-reverse transcriptase